MAKAPFNPIGRSVTFGWAADPFGLQFPELSASDAGRFDMINEALMCLRVHGLLSDSQRDAVIAKAKKNLLATLQGATRPQATPVKGE